MSPTAERVPTWARIFALLWLVVGAAMALVGGIRADLWLVVFGVLIALVGLILPFAQQRRPRR